MKPQTHSCWLEQWSWIWRHHFSLLGQHGLGKQMGRNVYWPEKFDSGCLGSVLLIIMSLLKGPSGVPSGPTIFSDMHRYAFFCSEIYQLRAGSVFRTFPCVCVCGGEIPALTAQNHPSLASGQCIPGGRPCVSSFLLCLLWEPLWQFPSQSQLRRMDASAHALGDKHLLQACFPFWFCF